MSARHAEFHYSITIATEDLAVVYCLRALADFSQATGNSRIAWGGTKDDDWRNAGRRVCFRFTNPRYREDFHSHATRLLPATAWREVARSDSDPATPQA